VAHDENLNYRVPGHLKEKWAGSCEKKRISQTAGIIAVMEFYLAQDEVMQSMILGQIPADDDLIELVLKRVQERGKR
jgi:hypothetical protein